MDVEIIVNNRNKKEILFGDFVFVHRGCSLMKAHRNPATNLHTLSCQCGLEIKFEDMSSAMSNIIDSVTDGEIRSLPAGSFTSKNAKNVSLVPN